LAAFVGFRLGKGGEGVPESAGQNGFPNALKDDSRCQTKEGISIRELTSDDEWTFFEPFVIETGPKRDRPPRDRRRGPFRRRGGKDRDAPVEGKTILARRNTEGHFPQSPEKVISNPTPSAA